MSKTSDLHQQALRNSVAEAMRLAEENRKTRAEGMAKGSLTLEQLCLLDREYLKLLDLRDRKLAQLAEGGKQDALHDRLARRLAARTPRAAPVASGEGGATPKAISQPEAREGQPGAEQEPPITQNHPRAGEGEDQHGLA
jgi:hypothetical protein